MQFGERLKQQRTLKGVTQETAAAVFHVSRPTIASWEHERSYPDIDHLIAISDYYHVSLDVLLKEDIGMSEAMQRKLELQKLKPFYWSSLLIDGLVLLALVGHAYQLPGLNSAHFMAMMLTLICAVNAYMLITVRNRQRQLAIDGNGQDRYLALIFAAIVIGLIVILAVIAKQWQAIGIVCGAGLVSILSRNKRRTTKE